MGRKELFAWPGGKFEEKPISDFAAGGMMGDGAFTLFADDVFLNHAATMHYHGPEQLRDGPRSAWIMRWVRCGAGSA